MAFDSSDPADIVGAVNRSDLYSRPAWQADASCADYSPEPFFTMSPVVIARAKLLCVGCLVRVECLAYALEHDAVGLWGGTTTSERQKY